MFSIEFDIYREGAAASPPDTCGGTITIGGFQERFISLLSYWSRADYEKQWREAVSRIVVDGSNSCLITSIADPTVSHLLFWWPLYREGEIVHVHSGILFFDQLDQSFDPRNPYRSVPPRQQISDDGERISSWQTTVADFARYLIA